MQKTSCIDQEPRRERVPTFSIRCYEPKDYHVVRQMFKCCCLELVMPGFRWSLRQPASIALFLVCGSISYALTYSLWYVILAATALAAVMYYACWRIFTDFMKLKLQTEMGNIEKYYIKPPGSCFWVAEADGKVIGTIAVKRLPEHQEACELFRMFVQHKFCRCGLAKKLLETAFEFAKDYGYKTCHVQTNITQVPAVYMYKKMGFQQYGKCHLIGSCLTFLTQISDLRLKKAI
ncbi:probable N-acetyltransferase CML5 isoform X2 [Protopterus annectens]|nr:probable N-acetyltransferase CML5 isoform X2 [Protopterus annectens]